MAEKACELCSGRARLYCTSDAAFLCFKCDADVHQANFLVARHSRELLCTRCASFAGVSISGAAAPRRRSPLCRSCSVPGHKPAPSTVNVEDEGEDEDVSDSESSSLTCASTWSGAGRKRSGAWAADATLERWCKRLGWGSRKSLAAEAMRSAGVSAMPTKVGLAGALWFAAARGGGGAAELGRLERFSGVPARVIVWAELRLRRLMKVKPINNGSCKDDEQEGWAEC